VTLLRQYQELAATTQDIVSTDIPRSALDDFVDLAFLVKDASVRSVVFDANLIDPAYPDYDQMRQVVRDALSPAPDGPADRAPADDAPRTTEPSTPVTTDPAIPSTSGDVAADVADACAYDPVQARAALAAGEPPTRRR
jgi:hypothetical protein